MNAISIFGGIPISGTLGFALCFLGGLFVLFVLAALADTRSLPRRTITHNIDEESEGGEDDEEA